jgi:hypothetical protein
MSSIRSILIRTCMSNIQKEFSQLEHWLNNLPDDISEAGSFESPSTNLTRNFEYINRTIENQGHTLNNILERLDALEGFRHLEREVFIDENKTSNVKDPWLDEDCEPLQNEIIGDDISEPLYTVNKKSELSTGTPSIIPDVPEDRSLPPDIESDSESEQDLTPVQTSLLTSVKVESPTVVVDLNKLKNMIIFKNEPIKPNIEEKVQEIKEKEVEKREVVEEEVEEEEVVEEEVIEEEVEEEEEEEVEEEEVVEEEEEEEEVVEEEEEEEEVVEEEEEGVELEEIEYNGKKYFKDAEKFIYSIDEEEQPSENPIGYWKDKTNSIAFYKTK